MTITWGKIQFDGPYPISKWDPPCKAAIYAIMIRPDPENKPNEYRIIYFGESGNLSERGFYRSHDKYGCWISQAGSDANLHIAIHPMPNSTEKDRREVEKKLILQYKPKCNE